MVLQEGPVWCYRKTVMVLQKTVMVLQKNGNGVTSETCLVLSAGSAQPAKGAVTWK
jgi:hypothetical protein